MHLTFYSVDRRRRRQAVGDDGRLEGDDRFAGDKRALDPRRQRHSGHGRHLTSLYSLLPCGRSRTGTGARLRTVWRKPWRFDSSRPQTAKWTCPARRRTGSVSLRGGGQGRDRAKARLAGRAVRGSTGRPGLHVDRPVQTGDFLTVDTHILRSGAVLVGESQTDAQLEVDKERLIAGLAEGLVGIRPNETRDIRLTLPEDYPKKDLAGSEVTFRVTVKSIKERQLPALNDELAQQVGRGQTMQE